MPGQTRQPQKWNLMRGGGDDPSTSGLSEKKYLGGEKSHESKKTPLGRKTKERGKIERMAESKKTKKRREGG